MNLIPLSPIPLSESQPAPHPIGLDRMNKMKRMAANLGGETFYPVNPVNPVKGFGSEKMGIF
jgi:hypothetical protein